MANRKSLVDKILNLTEDRTTTVTPSFLEAMIPLMSILYFSGGAEGLGKMLGIGGKAQGLQDKLLQGTASSIVGDIRGASPEASAMGALSGAGVSPIGGGYEKLIPGFLEKGGGKLTPELIKMIMMMLGGRKIGF